MDIFDDIANESFENSKSNLERFYDKMYPGWEEQEVPTEFETVSLLDKAGLPFVCSVCEHSDLWAMTSYGKWRCAGQHEPMWTPMGYIEQVIEVLPDEVI